MYYKFYTGCPQSGKFRSDQKSWNFQLGQGISQIHVEVRGKSGNFIYTPSLHTGGYIMESMGLVFLFKDVYHPRSYIPTNMPGPSILTRRPKWPANEIGSARLCRTFFAKNNFVLSIYDNQFKISIHAVIVVITRLGKKLYWENKIFFVHCVLHKHYKKGRMDDVRADGKLLIDKRCAFLGFKYLNFIL